MATIVLLHHRFEDFWSRAPGQSRLSHARKPLYLMGHILRILEARGHRIVTTGKPWWVPRGDILIVHVNASVVDDEYLNVAQRFPVSVNARVRDIRKRTISRILLAPDSDWSGPVFVKSDLNYRAIPELRHNENARRRYRKLPHPGVRTCEYAVFPSIREVPDEVWADPQRVVEKFVSEPVADGFALRTYVFCGSAERCGLSVTAEAFVKGDKVIRSESIPVPDYARAWRAELGHDYGKYDFVVHEGVPILLDANKTLGGSSAAPELAERIRAGNEALADGLIGMLRGSP